MYKTNNNSSALISEYAQIPKEDKSILIFAVANTRGSNLTQLQSDLQEKYTTVDVMMTERGNVANDVNNNLMPIANNYDLVICDSYAWGTGNIANQSTLNYNLITISNDASMSDNNLIGSSTHAETAVIQNIESQTGVLSDLPINVTNEGESNSSITKIRFRNGVRVLMTAKYFDDDSTYDVVGYTTIGAYKQIHSQTVFNNNYVEVVEKLVELAFE